MLHCNTLAPSTGVSNSESKVKVTLPKKKVYVVRKRPTADVGEAAASIPAADPAPSRKRRSQEGVVAALKVQKSSSTATKGELM